jgi:hypothetical protein
MEATLSPIYLLLPLDLGQYANCSGDIFMEAVRKVSSAFSLTAINTDSLEAVM